MPGCFGNGLFECKLLYAPLSKSGQQAAFCYAEAIAPYNIGTKLGTKEVTARAT